VTISTYDKNNKKIINGKERKYIGIKTFENKVLMWSIVRKKEEVTGNK